MEKSVDQAFSENKQTLAELQKLEQDMKLGFWGRISAAFSAAASDATHTAMGDGQ